VGEESVVLCVGRLMAPHSFVFQQTLRGQAKHTSASAGEPQTFPAGVSLLVFFVEAEEERGPDRNPKDHAGETARETLP